jgi:threonine dehydrogenase-like Zn-dependent dehydrogenase
MAARDFPQILDMVAAKKLDPESLIERVCTLSEGAAAIQAP